MPNKYEMNFCQSAYFCFLEELRDDYNAELFVGANETVRNMRVSVKAGFHCIYFCFAW